MRTAFVIVGYHNLCWFRVGWQSFLDHVAPADDVYMVNANGANWYNNLSERCAAEKIEFQKQYGQHPKYLELPFLGKYDAKSGYYEAGTHGLALDLAAERAQQNGYTHIVFIEPDCLFTGSGWLRALEKQAKIGVAAAGIDVRSYGPLFPCGSIWRLPLPATCASKAKDPQVLESATYKRYEKSIKNLSPADQIWYQHWWDTAQLAWYQLVCADQTPVHIGKQPGFLHFFRGIHKKPEDLGGLPHTAHPRWSHVRRYLELG